MHERGASDGTWCTPAGVAVTYARFRRAPPAVLGRHQGTLPFVLRGVRRFSAVRRFSPERFFNAERRLMPGIIGHGAGAVQSGCDGADGGTLTLRA